VKSASLSPSGISQDKFDWLDEPEALFASWSLRAMGAFGSSGAVRTEGSIENGAAFFCQTVSSRQSCTASHTEPLPF
jgi:hypothetical protein